MDLVLLLKTEYLKNDIRELQDIISRKEELKILRKKLVAVEREIEKQCKNDGHCFDNIGVFYEKEKNLV